MHRAELLNLLQNYHTGFMDEVAYVSRAINFIREYENIFDRGMPVHVTASTWVVNPERDKVLLMHHRKYNQWFQPGGHADGDSDVIRVALRECAEETGIDSAHVKLLKTDIFDVDLHEVPAVGHVAEHGHIDIRFLVEIDDSLPIPGNRESHEVKWFSLYQVMHINKLRSTYRMLEKTRAMRNPVNTVRLCSV